MDFSIAKEIHQAAIEHGWWDEPRSFGEVCALIHSELSEALEEYRSGSDNAYYSCRECGGMPCDVLKTADVKCSYLRDKDITAILKPEGVAVELADCVIRILDYLVESEADLSKFKMNFSTITKFEKGYNASFGDFITHCHLCISNAYAYEDETDDTAISTISSLTDCVTYIYAWAKECGVDMDEVIRIKHEYNKTRPYRHGGKKL